jgi:hypothetical protein
MTFCEVTYRYQRDLSEPQLLALDRLKGQLYGIKAFEIQDTAKALTVRYDASRLTLQDVEHAVRMAGVAIVGAVTAEK